MNLSTFLIILFVFIILFSLSFLIENKTYKIFYFLIMALGGITFLNIYIGVLYYIKLRNEPGIPGPRGPKGEKGPKGKTGKCIINEKCTFTRDDAIKMINTEIANKFDTTEECLTRTNINNCGSRQEVNRINKDIKPIIETIKKVAFADNKVMDRQTLQSTLNTILF